MPLGGGYFKENDIETPNIPSADSPRPQPPASEIGDFHERKPTLEDSGNQDSAANRILAGQQLEEALDFADMPVEFIVPRPPNASEARWLDLSDVTHLAKGTTELGVQASLPAQLMVGDEFQFSVRVIDNLAGGHSLNFGLTKVDHVAFEGALPAAPGADFTVEDIPTPAALASGALSRLTHLDARFAFSDVNAGVTTYDVTISPNIGRTADGDASETFQIQFDAENRIVGDDVRQVDVQWDGVEHARGSIIALDFSQIVVDMSANANSAPDGPSPLTATVNHSGATFKIDVTTDNADDAISSVDNGFVRFDWDGTLVSPSHPVLAIDWSDREGFSPNSAITLDLGTVGYKDGTSIGGNNFELRAVSQNGAEASALSGIAKTDDGFFAYFENGLRLPVSATSENSVGVTAEMLQPGAFWLDLGVAGRAGATIAAQSRPEATGADPWDRSGQDLFDDLDGSNTPEIEDLSGSLKSGGQRISASDDDIRGIDAFERMTGSMLGDLLQASAVAARLVGRSGDDALVGGGFADRLFGNSGGDVLSGQNGDDYLSGGGGDDVLNGGGGNDVAFGGGGDDQIFGFDGDDRFVGMSGRDRYDGEGGFDTLDLESLSSGVKSSGQRIWTVDGDIADIQGFEHISGSMFDDVLKADVASARLVGRSGDDALVGGDLADRLFGNSGDDALRGGGGRDYLSGSGGNDLLNGGGGQDRAFGGDGDDVIIGSDGNDVLDGGAGDDRAHGGKANDYLAGGEGNDRLKGGDGQDILDGGDGDDHLFGGAGEDRIFGGGGADRLAGGAGGDIFVFEPGDNDDVISDWESGVDRISLTAFGPLAFETDVKPFLTEIGAKVLLSFGEGNSISILGIAATELSSNDFFLAG